MRNGSERRSSSSSAPLDCDVGLGLKMQLQPTESYSCDGGGAFFSSTSNQGVCGGDMHEAADSLVLPRSLHYSGFRASGGGMPVSGKALFTASQWQELERQKMISKYMMASIPVPPELLLPNSRAPALASVSQSNTSGLDLRFSSSGSDPEPWRCKRTDGKKWRCSRDVAPDQKYCERHAHKSRPRSRKHVEVSSHNTSNSYSQSPHILPSTATTTTSTVTTLQPLQRSTCQFPTMASATSYEQTRCIEWFMRGGCSGTIPVSICNQPQWQQVMQTSSSSRLELNGDNTDHNKNVSVYQPHQYEDRQSLMSLSSPYIPDTSGLQRLENDHNGQSCNSILDSKICSSETRHFIDAWEKEAFDGINTRSKKFSPSSLTLSMSGGNGIEEDGENSGHLGFGVKNSDRESDGILKVPPWMTPLSWMNSPPGGPLGEALCLGNAGATRGSSNLASPHGYSNSNTNSSSCSKSSCEDGSHALNFIG